MSFVLNGDIFKGISWGKILLSEKIYAYERVGSMYFFGIVEMSIRLQAFSFHYISANYVNRNAAFNS